MSGDLLVFAILALCLAVAAILIRLHRDEPRLLSREGWALVVVGLIAALTTDSTGPSIAGVAVVLAGVGVLFWARKIRSQ